MSILSDTIKKIRRPFCSMVVAAAGNSSRMGEDKLLLEIGGMPVIIRTLLAFEKCEAVDEIIVVTREDLIEKCAALCMEYGIEKANKFLIGGSDRLHSALAGVMEASEEAKLIGIHDGARPFVTGELIENVVQCAAKFDAAAPAVPVNDTIKLAADGVVEATPVRDNVFAVQTPQVFLPDIIKCALTAAAENELAITDDCSAVEELGMPVRLVTGDADNIKLTTPRDIDLGRIILRQREAELCE